jgi:hypothetical protein
MASSRTIDARTVARGRDVTEETRPRRWVGFLILVDFATRTIAIHIDP